MKRDDKIAYCDFHGGSLNFVTGCTKVSEGCRFCWAEAIYKRFQLRDFSVVQTHPDKLRRLQRKRFPMDGNVRGPHSKPICFVCDTGDLFHPLVPDEFILQALVTMLDRRGVVWLVLTKRAERLYDVLAEYEMGLENAVHVWFGVTAENQACLDDRWVWLEIAPVAKRWISVEPMLGPIDLGDARPDWVVVGGESGPNRRPFDKAWAIDLQEQCASFEIPYFFKQSSGLYPGTDPMLLGREWKSWPR